MEIRKLIWQAINNHYSVTDPVRLEARLKHENNKTIAQTIAIGLCHQYGLDREETEVLLCMDSTGYDTKLEVFRRMLTISIEQWRQGFPNGGEETLKDFLNRYVMTSRYVRRRIKPYLQIT